LRPLDDRRHVAIIGPLFALAGRLAGRVLNSVLGWATILLFGKVEGRKQTILLVIALASLLWVLVLIGIALPAAGTFLLALVPKPEFVPDWVVRLILLAVAAAIPLFVGVAAVYVTEPASRPQGRGLVTGVLRGYPFTFILAVTIVLLSGVALSRKVRSLSKRWDDAHVPMIVKPGGYDRLVQDLRAVMLDAGIDVRQRPAPSVMSVPSKLLDAVAGKSLGGLVPDRLVLLQARNLEVLIYPSDVAISGSKEAVARSRAAIASKLTTSPVYMTASAESERIEDELMAMATDGNTDAGAAAERLRRLDARIAALQVPFDEWETVYRERLQVERMLLDRIIDQRRAEDRAASSSGRHVAGWTEPAEPVAIRILSWVGLGVIAADAVARVARRAWSARRAARQRNGLLGRWPWRRRFEP
jgi:hypothetical protein